MLVEARIVRDRIGRLATMPAAHEPKTTHRRLRRSPDRRRHRSWRILASATALAFATKRIDAEQAAF